MASLMDMLTGGDEYSQERENAENPKAHDEIDSLIDDFKSSSPLDNEEIMNLVIGGGIGGAPGSYQVINKLIKTMGGKDVTKIGKSLIDVIQKRNKMGIKGLTDLGKKPNVDKSRREATKGIENLSEYIKNRATTKGELVPLTKEIQKGGKGELVDYLLAMLTGGAAGTMARNIPAVENISDRLAEFLAPDPQWLQNNPPPSKESLDMYFEDMIRERGRPADPIMWERGESY